MNTCFFSYSQVRSSAVHLVIAVASLFPLLALGQVKERPSGARHPLTQLIDESPVFSRIFTGFALFDPESGEYLYEKDDEKYFTPASNTKLLTFYTALQVLGDSLPVLRYVISGDSLVFWGTGNPLFLHPAFPPDSMVLRFLRSWPGQLFFSPHNYLDDRFGPGWSWADYANAYQAEKSPFPMYGNLVAFSRGQLSSGFDVQPAFFRRLVVFNPEMDNQQPDVRRREDTNLFEYNAAAMTGLPFDRSRPFRYTPELIAGLLSDTLHRPVQVLDLKQLPPRNAYTLTAPIPDTLYRFFLQESDNFIGEQFLLVVSDKLYGVQQTEQAIRYATDNLFAGAPDKPVWADGSGLSRYNLFTPRTIVWTLNQLYRTVPRERLFSLLPAGGVSGTIKDLYAGPAGRPFVFAKTGTLANKHCLSGFVVTRRNRVLIFSFMLNNYINGTGEMKEEMGKVLRWIYQNY